MHKGHLQRFVAAFTLPTQTNIPSADSVAVIAECLDWTLIVNAQHLERTLAVFVDHYNGHRPHRSLNLAPPNGRPATARWTGSHALAIRRRDRLGRLVHEYERAA